MPVSASGYDPGIAAFGSFRAPVNRRVCPRGKGTRRPNLPVKGLPPTFQVFRPADALYARRLARARRSGFALMAG